MLWKIQRELAFAALTALAALLLLNAPDTGRSETGLTLINYQQSFAREIFLENQRLRALAGLTAQRPVMISGIGKVVALDPIGRPTWLTVESSLSGPTPRPLVALDREGNLVGRVVEIDGGRVRVMTLANPASRVSVALQESRNLGILESSGPFMNLAVNYIGNASRVIARETVVTSAIGRLYPQGIPVGVVERARPGPALFQEVIVRPNANFSRLEEVVLVY